MGEDDKPKTRRVSKHVVLWIFAFVFIAVSAVVTTLLVAKHKPEILGLSKGSASVRNEEEEMIAAVGRLMVLPQEQPTLASVTDAEKLKDQPFFAKAENGDKVLIYTEARKAILYRPSLHIIVDVAAVNLGTPSATVAANPLQVFLYNGTTKNGHTKTYEATMKGKASGFIVVDRDNASTPEYDKTVMVVLQSAASDKAKELATALGIDIVSLPAGEEAPKNADVLIIVGSNE